MNRFLMMKKNQEIVWIAFLAVIQIIFLWLNELYPVVGYWLTFFLPFFTIMVLQLASSKGFLIYTATIALLIVFLLPTFIETLSFYFLPAWLLGIGYGVALKRKMSLLSLVVVLSLIQFVTLLLVRWVSLQLYQVDLLAFIYRLLNLSEVQGLAVLNPIMLYTIALLQVLMSLLLMLPLVERFHLTPNYRLEFSWLETYAFIALFAIALFFTWLAPAIAFYAIGPLTFMTVYAYVYYFMKPTRFDPYILLIGLVLYPFVNASLSSVLSGPFRILSSLFLAFIPLTLLVFKSFIQKKKNALI